MGLFRFVPTHSIAYSYKGKQQTRCPDDTRSCTFHDAIDDNADRDNAGVSVHTIGPLNHKECYEVTRDKHEAPKSRRVSFKATQTATEILKDCKYAVPNGVRTRKRLPSEICP